ncbi:hypothetical protein IMZ48_30020 [Candidatus Bathyarchaeota archaeon]|nr:hypothetical protein [Candidatus Bathyarchaeota archaeon]
MSKLSPSLKALVNAPFARGDPVAAPARIRDVYQGIARDAKRRNVGLKPWLALSVRFPFATLLISLP